MTDEEIKRKAEEMLLNVPKLRGDIIRLNYKIKSGYADEKLLGLREKKANELEYLIKIVSTFTEDNQQILCYKYFDGMRNAHIAKRLGVHPRTIYRRLDKLLFQIGLEYTNVLNKTSMK